MKDQPFVYKNLILNFNGEIYNYLELRKHHNKGHNLFNSDAGSNKILSYIRI